MTNFELAVISNFELSVETLPEESVLFACGNCRLLEDLDDLDCSGCILAASTKLCTLLCFSQPRTCVVCMWCCRLLEDLDDLDWSESIKDMQRNWIGRSEVSLSCLRGALMPPGGIWHQCCDTWVSYMACVARYILSRANTPQPMLCLHSSNQYKFE
jgi:hypothetical protein